MKRSRKNLGQTLEAQIAPKSDYPAPHFICYLADIQQWLVSE